MVDHVVELTYVRMYEYEDTEVQTETSRRDRPGRRRGKVPRHRARRRRRARPEDTRHGAPYARTHVRDEVLDRAKPKSAESGMTTGSSTARGQTLQPTTVRSVGVARRKPRQCRAWPRGKEKTKIRQSEATEEYGTTEKTPRRGRDGDDWTAEM